MGYGSSNQKPIEFAGKTGHIEFINKENEKFLLECFIPQENTSSTFLEKIVYKFKSIETNIRYVIAIDGGISFISPKKDYPSSEFVAINIGALLLDISKIEDLHREPFISPKEINKVKNIGKYQLLVPIKNVMHPKYKTFTEFVRGTIHEFFLKEDFELAESLKWLAFREFNIPEKEWNLATHPYGNKKNIKLIRNNFDENFTIIDEGKPVYIIDILRLHELIDEHIGARGIVNYLLSVIEQMLMVSVIKKIYTKNPKKLSEFLFILDRPLAFFGQTANLHKPMRELISFITNQDIQLNIVGLEKSGAFVEHAKALIKSGFLKKGQYVLLSNDYIYNNILPRNLNQYALYGSSTYYGGKLIFCSKEGNVNICTIPIDKYENIKKPSPINFINLDIILSMLEKLKCDMYENAILPIALINKAVSISKYPGEVSLERFVKEFILN